MRRTVAVSIMVAVLVTVGPAGAIADHPATDAGGTATQSSAYAGTHVTFDASGSAIVDYAVDNATMMSELTVQSEEAAESEGLVSIGASLSAVTNLEGSGLTLASETSTRADVRTEGSASVTAHDNPRGVFVVGSGGESQYVVANLSSGASAEAEGDSRVELTTANGTEGTFLVVGDGSVAVNDAGDVSAELGEDGRLVFRAYPDGKSDDTDEQERLIANGTAAAEVYVLSEAEGTVTDAINYSSDTTVEANQSAENAVEVTVDRTVEEGTVVITSVPESAVDSPSNLRVTVDGEAAVQASSYGELTGAIGSDESSYMVRETAGGSARASADVLVAVNHFSERTMRISDSESDGGGTTTDGSDDGDGSDGGDGSDDGDGTDGGDADTTASGGQPGFGLGLALVALAGGGLLASRRERRS